MSLASLEISHCRGEMALARGSERGQRDLEVLPAAGGAQAPASAPAAPAKQPDQVVALVDYHQHLASPAAAELLNRLSLPVPAVEMPPDVARLLRARAERWNDKAALADLYTEDSLVFDFDHPGWVRGRAAVAAHLSTFFARPFRLTPLDYAGGGSSGHVAGYFTRKDGASIRHFGFFYLELAQGGDGTWRIAVERSSFPGPPMQEPVTGEELVSLLDAAGMQRAVVLSGAYWFDMPKVSPGADAYAKVRAENDWIAREGGGAFSDEVLATFAEAVSSGHPATKNLYFDVSDAAPAADGSEEIARTIARRIRQIGLRRILYGSDAAGTHPPPREAWAAFRKGIPLTEEEFRTIANNVLPYVGGSREGSRETPPE
jgi:ketosteroid isomerase-like protein